MMLYVFCAFSFIATGQATENVMSTDTGKKVNFRNNIYKIFLIGFKSSPVPVDFIRKHPNAFSKEICKRIFDGAQILKFNNLNKPIVAEDISMTKTNVEAKFDKEETIKIMIQENLTTVIIILGTSFLSFGLVLINLRLLI